MRENGEVDYRMRTFRSWFRNMPFKWQEGLCAAMEGGMFIGELPAPDGKVKAVVIFAPAELQDVLEEAYRKAVG